MCKYILAGAFKSKWRLFFDFLLLYIALCCEKKKEIPKNNDTRKRMKKHIEKVAQIKWKQKN